jgi:hypothetical protein
MNIPDEVVDETGLVIAIKASGGAGGNDDLGGMDDGLGSGASGGNSGDVGGAGAPPMLMSTTDPDPATRRQAINWARQEKTDLKGRIKTAFESGRLDRPEARALLRRVESVEMSFHRETGEAVHPLAAKLKEVETRPEWSKWRKDGKRQGEATELSNTLGVTAPSELSPDAGLSSVVSEQERLAKQYSVAAAK